MKLGVNIDHVATLRQARKTTYPDPIFAAEQALRAGADNITCHLREDRRHIQDHDVVELRKKISLPLNFEMAATKEMVSFAKDLAPYTVTIVPERREELTTEGGLDVVKHRKSLEAFVSDLSRAPIAEVSLFVDPELSIIELSKKLGAHAVELHTGRYCELTDKDLIEGEFRKIAEAAAYAKELGLVVHAGHGIHYDNVTHLCQIADLHSLQIGHAIVARAVYVGMEAAVAQMRILIS